ncbi:GNAT family N-acetyltransferase [Paenibacillus sp. sptzw28]|uniref:GNAT family N-acetyltransferase n=1 Tax=Paenibacillus sp. sptzw28 TaxID=715179 RepID=UPI001C6DF960|nr:GNAT family N-acetyltransferase [Paenibacillus sp. sptzw28]QYR20292.1 GNAT family N-acetyltransferase [Paenibacillus sp. sptzw28]
MIASARKAALQTVSTVLAADLACSETDFLSDKVSVNKAEIREGRFRFPVREKSLSIVTMGKGVIVSCNQERIEWVEHTLENLRRGQVFSIQTVSKLEEYVKKDNQFIAGPDQKYICSVDDLVEFYIPQGIKVSTYTRNNVVELYEHLNFRHALSYRADTPRPDMLATIAECDGKIVGMAGASGDCELMWQVGVDVLPEYQGLGIGKAIVGTLTEAILNQGILPYYSTEVSNLQSRQLAVSLGYWPAWVQIYAR